MQIFSDHAISNHANSNILSSSRDPNGYSRNYLEDQELLEKEHFDDIKVAEADQGYINRYNLIYRPSGSCNSCEIRNCIEFFALPSGNERALFSHLFIEFTLTN